jgi:hypothetical protein
VTLALCYRHVGASRNDGASREPLDWQDGVLAAIGLGGVAYGLTAGPALGWTHPAVLSALLIGTLVLVLFLYHDARAAAPMVPLRLFRSAPFAGANAVTLLLYFALSGALFLLPFNLIRFQGYSAAQAGAAFLPFTIVMGTLSRWAGGLVERYGARAPLVIGQAIAAAGFALLALPGIGHSYWTTFFPAMAVLGLGMAVSVAPLTTAVMGAIEDRYAGIAAGVNNAIARVAGMLAVALLGAVAVGISAASLDRRLGELSVPAELRRTLDAEAPMLGRAMVAPDTTDERQRAIEQAVNQSFLLGFRVVMLVAAGLALAGAQCARLTIEPRRPAEDIQSKHRRRGS